MQNISPEEKIAGQLHSEQFLPEWQLAGKFTGNDVHQFVVIAPGSEKKRSAYNSAVAVLCERPESPKICGLYFFASTDRVPPTQPLGTFFKDGGFRDYPMLALYWRNQNSGVAEFTTWDCKRAGIQGSPITALCDPVVSNNQNAASRLGSRTSNVAGCGWPQTDDVANFATFLATVPDLEQRQLYRTTFDDMNSGKGPDDRSNCIKLRERMEENAQLARQTLGIPQPPQAPAAQPTAAARRKNTL